MTKQMKRQTMLAAGLLAILWISLQVKTDPAAGPGPAAMTFQAEPEGLQAWQQEALIRIPNVSSKVTGIEWAQSGHLWITVQDDGTNWDKAGRSFCLTLEGAGKPAGRRVGMTFWRNGMTFWRNDDVITRVYCS